MRPRLFFLLFSFFLIFACCSDPIQTITIGGYEARILVADDDNTRTKGLMFREDLGDVDGMLFIFDEPKIANFWMKNTPLPLTLAYLDEGGMIFQIEYLEPYDTATLHISSKKILYAIELERGWLRERGLGVGAKVDLGQRLKKE